MRTASRSLACLVALAAVFAARSAAAAPPSDDLELSADVRAFFLREMPTFELSAPTHTTGRTIPVGSLPSTGSQAFVGFAGDFAYVRDQRWQVPILGLAFGGAIGESPRVFSSVDGTIVAMKPWTTVACTLLLPGVGVRGKSRRWMFDMNVRGVATILWMSADFGSGDVSDNGASSVFAGTFGVRGHLEACRRLDPENRFCAFVEPHLYEFSAMNGGTAGLRWEWGR